jgi:AcrR family transcriptional regulator
MTKVYAKLYTMSSGDPETRKRILEKTWHLMEKRRGQGVKISDIARAAGVSRQAVYLHFGSRAQLLVATVRYVDEVKNINERLEGMSTAANALQVLENYVEFWGNYIPEIYGLAKALLAVRESDRDAAAAWDDRMEALHQGWRSVVECFVREDLLAPEWDPNRAADAAWAITSVTVWENLTVERGWSTDEYVDQMKMVLKRLLVKK